MKKSFFKYIIPIVFLFVLTAFNFSDVMIGSWNPQYVYNTYGQSIKDMAFADSLNGYICTWHPYNNDGSILITTNGGDNWIVSYSSLDSGIFNGVQVLNKDTCLACRDYGILRTTNKGINWSITAGPYIDVGLYSFYALNFDTIWVGAGTGFYQPQLFLTTNGGINWLIKYQTATGSQFSCVYFYNKRIGFCSSDNAIYKTTNGGANWFWISNEQYTNKIQFIDSLMGWKCTSNWILKKTIDGGYSWISQPIPNNIHVSSDVLDFSIINKDTIWASGSSYYSPPPYSSKGIIWRTTNGGVSWGYQLPDTNIIKFNRYGPMCFINSKIGWVYDGTGGVHTVTGGLDSTVYVGIKSQNENITTDYVLYQNYPNPFNPVTNNRYSVPSNVKREMSNVKIVIYDLLGKEVVTLVNEKQKAGVREVTFNAVSLSSGIYYYALYADGVRGDARKMVLLK